MAIAFNLPSEREATEENFSRLNRLLTELYEVLCHILVARQPGQETQENRRDRPFSDSDLDRPTFSGLPDITPAPGRRPGSAISPPPPLLNLEELEDDVFISPRGDNGNDPFSMRHMEIFGTRFGSPRTPAGVLLSPRRERRFTFSVSSEKHWRDKGGTGGQEVEVEVDEADGVSLPSDADEPDSPTPEPSTKGSTSSENSIFSSIIPDKLSGSICTAVLFMLGWKLLSNNR